MHSHQQSTPEPSVSTGFMQVNGSQLYYEVAGSGHPLIMLPARNFLDRRIWDEQFTTLAQFYRVVRYDGRGSGKSTASTELYKQEDDLAQIMRTLALESAYLLDLGGGIALNFAHEYPTRVDALLITSPSISPYASSAEAQATLPQILEHFTPVIDALRQHDTQHAIDLIIQDLHLSPSLSAASSHQIRTIVTDNLHSILQPSRPPIIDTQSFDTRSQWLPHIQAPTLLLVGEHTLPEIQSGVQTIVKYVPDVQSSEIAGAQFLLNVEQPQEFNQVVLAFLHGAFAKYMNTPHW